MSSEVGKRRRIIKYKCPFCDTKIERSPLITHVSNKHEDELPEGFSPLRYVFHYVNKKPLTYHGICTECKGPTEWDENKGRYNRQCEKKACHDRYVAKFEENMRRKRGITRISATAEGQEKMLANRKISGKYKWSDGTEKTYTGKYELHTLEFMDKVMHLDSKDVFCPGPVLEYVYEGKKHLYITDFYYQPYDLIIEVKDGGNNPNKRNMPEYRAKQIAKEKYIIENTDFNYIRLTNDNLDQLLAVFMDLKMQLVDDTKDRVVHVNESVIVEASLGSFKKVKIDEELVKSDSHFKHLRTENCTGYAYYNNDKLVGYINTEDKDGEVWIQALEVMPEYRKTGIGKKLLDFAVRNLKANYLSVNKKNAIAIRMYKNYGFEVYRETDTMYFMSYKKAVEESVVFNEKDILYNKEAFDNGDINLCFITGHSGSGKSTMAIGQEKENVDVSNMDFLQTPGDTFKNIEDMKKNCEYCSELIYQFFKGPGKKYFVGIEDIEDLPGTEYEDKVFVEFVDFAKKYAKSHKNKKFICEGIYFFLNKSDNSGEMVFKPQWFDDYAFYIKGTSALISKFRSAKRDSQDNWNGLKPNKDENKSKGLKRVANFFRHFFRKNSLKWYMCDEKNLNVFRDYFKNKPETVLESYIEERSLPKGEVTLYHGSCNGSIDKMLNNSINAGKKWEKPRKSSFWFLKKEYAIMFATAELLQKEAKAMIGSDKIYILIDNDMKTLVNEEYKSTAEKIMKTKQTYVYSKTVDGKYVSGGQGRNFPEYTLDFEVVPDDMYICTYEDMKKSVKYVSEDYINTIIQMYKKDKMTYDNNIFGRIIDNVIYNSFKDIRKIRKNVLSYDESYIEEASKYNGKILYHVSEDNLNDKTLQPKVPDNYMTKNGYEDSEIARVCFSTSVQGCLMALSKKCNDMELYVHTPDDISKYEVLSPNQSEVPDSKITKEKWICSPVKVKCIGKIRVTGDAGEDGIPYSYGDKEAELYKWNYEWIEKYDSVNEAGLFNFKKKEIDQLNQNIIDKINSSKYPWFFIHIQTQGKDSIVELYGFEKDPETNSSKDSKGIFSAGVKYKMLLEKKFKNFYFSKADLDSKLKKFAKSNCGAAKDKDIVLSEEVLEEISRSDISSKFLEKDDTCYNLDRWEIGDSNILYVIGMSGSGKSTLSNDMKVEFDTKSVDLDHIGILYIEKTKLKGKIEKYKKMVIDNCPEAADFFKYYPIEENCTRQGWLDTLGIIKLFCDWFAGKVEKNKDRYIVNGTWLPIIYEPEYFYQKPVILKNINFLKGALRRLGRSVSDKEDSLGKKIFKAYTALKFYLGKDNRSQYKTMKKYRDSMNKNAPVKEATNFSNYTILDIKSNKSKVLEYLKNNSETSEYAKDIVDNYNGEIIIVDNAMIGRIFIGDKKDKGFITDFSIDEEYRGNKIGNKLLDDAINKYGGYDLLVDKDNYIAIAMYKKRGFVVYKTVKNQYWMRLESKNESVFMEHMNALLTGFVPGIDSKGSIMVAAPNMQNTVFAGTSCNDDDFWIVKNNKFDEIIHRNEAGVLVRESVPKSKHPDLMNLYKVNNADYNKISKTICENLGKEVSNTFLYETVFGHKCGNAFDVVFEDVSEVLAEDKIEECIKEAIRNDILGTGLEFPVYKEDKLGVIEHSVYLDENESISYNGIKFTRGYHITKEDCTYKFLKLLAEGNVDG